MVLYVYMCVCAVVGVVVGMGVGGGGRGPEVSPESMTYVVSAGTILQLGTLIIVNLI